MKIWCSRFSGGPTSLRSRPSWSEMSNARTDVPIGGKTTSGDIGRTIIVRDPAETERYAGAMILYKYVPPVRIDILRNGHIAFPPPWLFNDPFEASPVYAADAS